MTLKRISSDYKKLAFCDECYQHCSDRDLIKITPRASKTSIYLCEKCVNKLYVKALEILSNSVRSENIVDG